LASFAVVAGGGTLIGIFVGYLCAFTTRFMEHARVLEPLIVLIFAYLSYLTAEIFHMSGILAITFCGITMKNYVEQNISEASSTTIRASAHMFANIAELTIFLFLGVFTVTGKDEFGEAIHE
jgi:sodium/hydrogen exchanger-like protein 3